jgi:hypothetical protein
MAECKGCKVALSGSWQLSQYHDNKTGRYLGIKDGYFIGKANWVDCYCSKCYPKAVLELALTYNEEKILQTYVCGETVSRLVFELGAEIKSLRHHNKYYIHEITSLQNSQIASANEIISLQEQQIVNTKEITTL